MWMGSGRVCELAPSAKSLKVAWCLVETLGTHNGGYFPSRNGARPIKLLRHTRNVARHPEASKSG
jgi:hypothetical protein